MKDVVHVSGGVEVVLSNGEVEQGDSKMHPVFLSHSPQTHMASWHHDTRPMHMHILSVLLCRRVKLLENSLNFGLITGCMVQARHTYARRSLSKIRVEEAG